MKIVIIEDEIPAAHRLEKMLLQFNPQINIVQKLDSVEASVQYLLKEDKPELIFMDIQLADGISFDIFDQVTISTPIIFTTAYDQYTLQAFKVNSIDYLLKPIAEKELHQSLEKYKQLYPKKDTDFSERILKMVQDIQKVRYKERLLIKRGQQLSFIKIENTAFCFADGKLCYAVDFTGNRFLLEQNLSELEVQLEPTIFYRINRHLMVHIDAIKKVHTWLGGRLKLELQPATTAETVVSRERVNGFKDWLGK